MTTVNRLVGTALLLGCLVTSGVCGTLEDTATVKLPEQATLDADPLYLRIETHDVQMFERLRYGENSGDEIVVSTVRTSAAEQAKFAELSRNVIVLPEGAKAPKGAKELVMYWGLHDVTAELNDGLHTKPKFLGVVSRTNFSSHPNSVGMWGEVNRAGLSMRKDSMLRANTQMYLYVSLQRAARELKKLSKG